MAEDDKAETVGEKTELTDAESDNFGAQPATEPAGYVANFDGDTIDGRTYKLGEKIDGSVDAGTIAYLVQNGRITGYSEDSAASPSGGEPGGTGIPQPEGDGPTLSAEQQADADKLVADNSKAELLKIAEDEGVEDVTDDNNKSEIAAKIVAGRTSE
jgi:hypothetical protein